MLRMNRYMPDFMRITGTVEEKKDKTKWDPTLYNQIKGSGYMGNNNSDFRKTRLTIIRYDKDRNIIAKYKTIYAATKVTGQTYTTIRAYAVSGKMYKDGYWKIEKRPKKAVRLPIAVSQYKIDGTLVKTHKSIRKAAIEMNCSVTSIIRHVGNGIPYKGFKWR